MKSEIKIRKKRYLAFLLALVFVIVQSIPLNVMAKSYTIDIDTEVGTIICQPNDSINYSMNNADQSARVNIVYKDYDGTVLKTTGTIISFFTVGEYTGLSGALPDEQFKGWKITGIESSGGYVCGVEFQAVAYTKSNIIYNLYGGTNNPLNPDFYYEGKENITLYPADGGVYYDFEGWHPNNMADSEEITTITTDMSGDIQLYAFFTAKSYNIIYHNVDGATNPNPSTYVCLEGITAFADATKKGYTFGGWYSDAEFTTEITDIPVTQYGDVDLYAKFTPNTYAINYELDGGENAATNPSEYTYGVGVAGFADATKTEHKFGGWYSDAGFTNKVTKITETQTGNITLYAKFTANTYTINYVLNGGKNAAINPTEYTYGVGVDSFADATKEGYTFNGWYSDAEFTNEVTKITGSQTGDITLYAKYTVNTYAINYELDGGENAATNPTEYTYGVGVDSFADASKDGYVFEGWYSDAEFKTEVTKITVTQTGNVTLYAKFVEKKEGTGSISVADVNYGILPSPVIVSETNATDKAVVEYKLKDAADAEYSTTKPAAVGAYVARATFPETDYYYEVIATCEFTISYLETPEVPYRIVGTTGEENYYVSDVAIVPAEGYLISYELDGTYSEKLNIESSTDIFTVYLMNASTGGKTTGIKVSQIKIDKIAPIIENVTTDGIVYTDSIEVTIRDVNLKNVFVNGEAVKIDNGKAILSLSSNNGEETYEIICTDIAGNKSEANIIVSADWMKDKIIPANETVKLVTKYSYTLGGGKWRLAGDNTTYSGGITFNVRSDGNYTFTSE